MHLRFARGTACIVKSLRHAKQVTGAWYVFAVACAGMDRNETDMIPAGRAAGTAGDWGEAAGVGSDELEDFASVGAAAEGEWKDAIDIGVDDEPAVSGAGGAGNFHGILNGKAGELHADTPGTDPTAAWRQKAIPSDLVVAGSALTKAWLIVWPACKLDSCSCRIGWLTVFQRN